MCTRKTTQQFIEDAKRVHGNDKYNYDAVEYINNKTKVKIYCNNCGEFFFQCPSNHLNGQNCRNCINKKRAKAQTKTTQEFIAKAKLIHGNKYNYSKVDYKSSSEYVIIICNECETEFLQTPNAHLQGKGCFSCGRKRGGFKKRKTTKEFIDEARKVHEDKYDYSKADYKLSSEYIIIICNECGTEFSQTPHTHLRGSGCDICSNKQVSMLLRSTTEEFIIKANMVHGDKYNYSKVNYTLSVEHIIIICNECKREFQQIANNHLRGAGCPNCWLKGYSKIAIQWLNFISNFEDIKIQHAENVGEYVIPSTNYKADGFCYETKTIFEFHGDFWHGNPRLYVPDEINSVNKRTMGELYKDTINRQTEIENLGYKVRFIWECDWKKIYKLILSYLEDYSTKTKSKKRKPVEIE